MKNKVHNYPNPDLVETGEKIGSPFDLFSIASHPDYRGISEEQYENRILLQKLC